MDKEDGLSIAFRLWAKTDRGSDRWHALPYHLIDVGSAATCLWDRLPEASLVTPVQALGDSNAARRCAVFLAAIHDIGKANRFFQAKDTKCQKRLEDLGVVDAREFRKHGQATTALLCPWLIENWSWSMAASSSVAVAVGGHHGSFVNDLELWRLDLDAGYAPSATSALIAAVAELYEVTEPVAEPHNLNAFLAWIAGFVSVADWLGSHESLTSWQEEPGDLRNYADEALKRAEALLDRINLVKPNPGVTLSIEDLVPPGSQPNDLQSVAAEVARSDFGLAIIEAPTGEGKTEAAFTLCEIGRSAGAGVYFALPTMATANGIHGRVSSYLRRATGIEGLETRLLHSQSWLYREEVAFVSNPGSDERQDTGEDWFSSAKRGLLAPYGVGTIDQGLVAALRAKHGFVRLFALAGKTVVVDEVHAYDVYMSDLLHRLLQWLRVLGCRVVLLSATLPTSRRLELIEAWGGDPYRVQVSYPSIVHVDCAGETHGRSLSASSRKPVDYQFVPQGQAEAWKFGTAKIAGLVARSGGFGALVLNTVREAQAAYAELKESVGRAIQVDLFHSRFTMQDRARKESQILADFGKEGERGTARILVATQVVEQSLDLDFDYMVSALAPIDLLIQRAGRLHRHRRSASGSLVNGNQMDQRPNPTLFVLEPSMDTNDVPIIADPVYEHDVLLKTHAFLQKGFTVREPSDVASAVDWVYDRAAQEVDRTAWLTRLEETTSRTEAKRDRYHENAEDVMICPPSGWYLITEGATGLDESDDTPGSQMAARTRLEDRPSVNLVIMGPSDPWPPDSYNKDVKRALALRTVRMPAYRLCQDELNDLDRPANWEQSGVSKYAVPIKLREDGGFETESYRFHYDEEVGLTAHRKNGEF